MELHFETIMRAAEQQLANEARELVATDHKTAATLVDIAVDKLAASYSTAEKLTLLAGVREIDELEVEIAARASVRKMSDLVTGMFKSCVEQRLAMVRSAIDVAIFCEGVLPAADAFIEVAERATFSDFWLPERKVVRMREVYHRLAAGEGGKEELDTLLTGAAIFNKILGAESVRQIHHEHGLDAVEVGRVSKDLKFYRDLLGPGWPLLPTALDQLNDARRRDAGLAPAQQPGPGPR
ncbi:hypothetical protein HFO56_02815 [Rhizobium laguerreae]|uniref:hypothetical protein n=1 Tax=Rhizobium laguerreae TaxID=1076926 RepID=UPI001C91A8C7|nr:hypothetical protein [Rhizobium laguerreae]MBY3151318.1 hypothetical protein [Rhizobium laguerreae]